ncbi:MAG: L-fuculose-phosphate aldolase [Brevinema sp.]
MLDSLDIRKEIIAYCLEMQKLGLNHGTAGNISHRVKNGMLVTPSGMPYHMMHPEDIVFIDSEGNIEKDKIPSTEWRFHFSILQYFPQCNAVIHNHALYATMVSILGIDYLPAIHYMIALAGTNKIPCAAYTRYGTEQLNENIKKVMGNSKACILKNHGLVATESSLQKALILIQEVEYLCQLYMGVRSAGQFTILSDHEIDIVLEGFQDYGLNVKHHKKG